MRFEPARVRPGSDGASSLANFPAFEIGGGTLNLGAGGPGGDGVLCTTGVD